jgi:FAD-dependent sensor of blue light
MLVRLLYASRATEAGLESLVEPILQQARRNNPELGITGVLCYGGDVFLQALEGGRDAVNALYNRIVADARHRKVTLLAYDEILERRFAGWTMGQVNLGKVNSSTLLKYSARALIDPYTLPGRISCALTAELVATASIIGRC